MTARGYPDRCAFSDDGSFVLEARSPDNGSINHRDGRAASEDDFGFRFGQEQRNFRYRLLDGKSRGVLWERWQGGRETSPEELVVSNDGWSVIRTDAWRAELIVVAPTGEDHLRVWIMPKSRSEEELCAPSESQGVPVFMWRPEAQYQWSSGFCWTEKSWRYFTTYKGQPYFVWRTCSDERLIVALVDCQVHWPEGDCDPCLVSFLAGEEARGASRLIAAVASRANEIAELLTSAERMEAPESEERDQLEVLPGALRLAGLCGLRECVPWLRALEAVDAPSGLRGCHALGDEWWIESQVFRGEVQHALRLLGREPAGWSPYSFVRGGWSDKVERLEVPECVRDRRSQARLITADLGAKAVLERLGAPDYIDAASRREGKYCVWTEYWDYEFSGARGWTTLRIGWEESDGQPRIVGIEESSSERLRAAAVEGVTVGCGPENSGE